MRSDKTTLRLRVEAVKLWRVQCARLTDIERSAAEQESAWDVSNRTLERYMRAAYELMLQEPPEDREKRLAFALARRDYLLAAALSVNDYATAARIEKDTCE